MPRTEEANQHIREERRHQILNFALKVFARKGLTDTRIADIAAESGMSQGLIYRYFASKEEVFATLVEGTLQLTVELIRQAEAQPGPALEKLRWLAAQLLPYQYEQPEGVLILLHALVNQAVPESLREMALRYSEEIQHLVRELIVQGQAEGQIIERDPAQLTIMYLSAFQGLAVAGRFIGSAAVMPDADTIIQFLKKPDN